ncbi:hypothetical protein E2320_006580 [Naja naja]|nr:hypothetical protein E2320_006580 [Naja naja]
MLSPPLGQLALFAKSLYLARTGKANVKNNYCFNKKGDHNRSLFGRDFCGGICFARLSKERSPPQKLTLKGMPGVLRAGAIPPNQESLGSTGGGGGLVRIPPLSPGVAGWHFQQSHPAEGLITPTLGNTSLISRQAFKDQGNCPPVQKYGCYCYVPGRAKNQPGLSKGFGLFFQKETHLVLAAPGLGFPGDGIRRCHWEGVAGPRIPVDGL